MKRLINLLFIFLIMISTIILFAACDLLELLLEPNCDSQMKDIREELGEPDYVKHYYAEDYHRVDWCYWGSPSIRYTFRWGETVGGCKVSTQPILRGECK